MLWWWLVACTPVVETEETDVSEPVPIVDHLTAQQLEAATRRLTDIGARLVATPEEQEAASVIEEWMAEVGIADVVRSPFVWDAWLPGPSQVRIGDVVYPAEPFSPSPAATGIIGPLRLQEPFTDGVALLSSRNGARIEQYLAANSGGAKALIRITHDLDHDGGPLLEVGHMVDGATLSAVGVDRPTGDALRAAAGQQVTVVVQSNVVRDHTSYNVVARVPGRDPRPVFVTAHYDSWHPSESAFDNALGVGMMMVLAQQLAQYPTPEHDVVFLATSGEEQGLKGAFAWVEDNAETAGAATLVINLDVAWSAEGTYVVMASEPERLAQGLALAESFGITGAIDGGVPGVASDHFPFSMRGAPTFWAGRWPDRHYHTHRDVADELNFDEAERVLRLHWALLVDAAGVTEGP